MSATRLLSAGAGACAIIALAVTAIDRGSPSGEPGIVVVAGPEGRHTTPAAASSPMPLTMAPAPAVPGPVEGQVPMPPRGPAPAYEAYSRTAPPYTENGGIGGNTAAYAAADPDFVMP